MPRRKRGPTKCRRCAEPIEFKLMVVGAGRTVWIPINADDKNPHGKRCNLRRALALAKRSESEGLKSITSRGLTSEASQKSGGVPLQGRLL